MTGPCSASPVRRLARRLAVVAASSALLVTTAIATAPPASADPVITPRSGAVTVSGAGYGHGWGMSQYGAYGAARWGLNWQGILAFYYPGTTLSTLTARSIRVWVTADNDGDLRFRPAAGAKISSGAKSYTLPTGSAYRTWRISRSGSGYRLRYLDASGTWRDRSTGLGTATWTVSTAKGIVTVVMPGVARREYRGTVSLIKRGSGGRTVNRVAMEHYVRSVVPSEMPTSWAPDAVAAQAVAARTYAARLRANAVSSGYDICDTTACQVYSGYAVTSGGRRTVKETAGGNAAARATANVILTYRGAIALTQFASSNGGHTASGDYPYLRPQPDPYDGVIKSQAWTRSISAASIGSRWGIGRLRSVQIIERDGAGRWGGRVERIKLVGSTRTLTITGTAFYRAYGLRSTLFTFGGVPAGPTPAPAPAPIIPPGTVPPGAAYATFPRTYGSPGAELLVVSPSGALRRYPAAGGRLGAPLTLAGGFGGYPNVINAGDWNGDGYQDVIVKTDQNRLRLFRGTRGGGLSAGVDLGGTANYRAVTSVGDLNGDRYPDLVAITDYGNLWLVLGDGQTGRGKSVRLATGWSGRDWIRGIGDLTGDGVPDLVSRSGDRLYLHMGSRSGFSVGVSLGSGWSGYSSIASVGDITGDGRPDLVARTRTGSLVLHAGTAAKNFAAAARLSDGFAGTRFAT